MMGREQLNAIADGYGFDVDPTWSDEVLVSKMTEAGIDLAEEQKIAEAEGKPAKPRKPRAKKKPEGVPMLAVRNVWDDDGNKVFKGQECYVSADTARLWMQTGAAKRNDPLPGEE